ncbi:hypothetical protein [Microbacterium wangruii]|uniref:hypothetical protein n=1 Tax=Microbacterium wangruii TaxID=3049073 RepID=UPI00256F52E6|nr:hypothetical protein [Microbacterium sp. zg-Y1211]MDL5487463.1 hypothetical protein [Microbacterium sp. zg-Y1211]
MMDGMRSQRVIPQTLRLDFALPSSEPMIWLPDIIAGVVGDERVGIAQYEGVRAAIDLHEVMI